MAAEGFIIWTHELYRSAKTLTYDKQFPNNYLTDFFEKTSQLPWSKVII